MCWGLVESVGERVLDLTGPSTYCGFCRGNMAMRFSANTSSPAR